MMTLQDVQFEKRSGWTRAMLKRVSKSYQVVSYTQLGEQRINTGQLGWKQESCVEFDNASQSICKFCLGVITNYFQRMTLYKNCVFFQELNGAVILVSKIYFIP